MIENEFKRYLALGLCAPGVWGGQKEATVSGVWVFNDGTLMFEGWFASGEVHTANFTSGDTEYSSMKFATNANGFLWKMSYGDSTVYDQYEDFYEDKHQTIDFGTTPQPVNENFYNWLVANATKKN